MASEIITGDCLKVIDKLIEDGVKVDLIVTSPPYNLGHHKRNQGGVLIKYNSYLDDLGYDEYEKWMINFLNKCYDVLSDRGKIYFNHKERHIKGKYFNPINLVQESKFNPLQTIIWQRGGVTFNIGRYVNCYEQIIVAYKTKEYMRIHKENEKQFDVWKITPSRGDKHPASYPVALTDRIISGYEQHKDVIILDPFMGSGTTGISAKKYNRDFIGIELDKDYVKYAEQRIKND